MARLLVFLFRSELWSKTQLSCDTVTSAQDRVFNLKIYLQFSAFSFWSVLTKWTLKNCQFFNLKQKPPFSPPTNSKWAKKHKSYTRNSFRQGRPSCGAQESRHRPCTVLCKQKWFHEIEFVFPSCSQLCWTSASTQDRQVLSHASISFIQSTLKVIILTSGELIYYFCPLLFVVFSHLASAL